jgi:hypothetical protein
MNATDARLQELRRRIARNRHLYLEGAAPAERARLQREVAGPLLGVAFLTGMVCGGGPGFAYAMRDPLIRNALRAFGGFIGAP